MSACPCCGHDPGPTAERGGLLVRSNPPEVSYGGATVKLTPQECAVLLVIVRMGTAPYFFLERQVGDVTNRRRLVKQVIHDIRGKLHPLGAPRVETLDAVGQRLAFDEGPAARRIRVTG